MFIGHYGVSFALKQLTDIRRGDVRLEDLDLSVTGEAEDVGAYRSIKQALANSVPKGIKVTADRVTAPVASPYTWAAHVADGRLVLSGHVPNDAVRADLVAAAKAGLRMISQSMAREYGAKGVHVAHVVIDGGINGYRLRSRRPQIVEERGEDGLLGVDAIAETYWQIHRQPRSAWTQEVDLRPFKESF